MTAVKTPITPSVCQRWPKKNASAFATSLFNSTVPDPRPSWISGDSRRPVWRENTPGRRPGSGAGPFRDQVSEVAGDEPADEVPVAQQVVGPPIVRIVEPGLPAGRSVLVEQDVHVHRFCALQVVRGERRRIALHGLE